ncbi:MAG: hypothetical protein ABJB04_03670 [Betaproteobacteria bacterium]
MDAKPALFKADRNQLIAIVAMLCAVFVFAVGELTIGFVLFAVAALFSLGGLFRQAHRQDQADAAEIKAHDEAMPGAGKHDEESK